MNNDNIDIPVFNQEAIEQAEHLTETAKEIMKSIQSKTFIIEKYKGQYINFVNMLFNTMLEGFEHEEFRTMNVMYKFRDDDNEPTKFMQFRHFIINTILWTPMMYLDPDNIGDFLIVPSSMMNKMTPSFIKNYIDENYISVYSRHIPAQSDLPVNAINKQLNIAIGETNYLLQRIASHFLKFFGISSSIETFKDLADRIPEMDDLFHYKLDETKQPAEMEEELNQLQNKAVNCILSDKEFNPLIPLLQPDSGLNLKQFRDTCLNIGLKPDLDGRTMSKPINTNFLTGGLTNETYYYMGAISGRKAQIINNEFMGKSGYLLILIAIATNNVRLSKTVVNCGSPNPIPINIKTEKHLAKLDGRRYRFRGDTEYHILNAKKDKHLIGEELLFKSPITCCAHDGICRECYGELYYTNIDNYATGIFSATYLMNPVVQGILSAKHHQVTNTKMIEFNEEFYKFFAISSTDIVVNVSPDINISDYSLVIRRDDINVADDEDDELDFSNQKSKKKKRKSKAQNEDSDSEFEGSSSESDDDDDDFEMKLPYFVTKFQVVKNLTDKTKENEYIDFEELEQKELFMHTDFIRMMILDSDENGEFLYIPLEDIPQEMFIFLVDVYNNEVTKPMKSIQNALNKKQHEGCDSYEELVNKMIDLIIESRLDAMSIHSEMIIRQLVRKTSNILKRPDFSDLVMRKDYQLLTVISALKYNPSITTSMSTSYLKSQLVNITETFAKSAASVFDPLFEQHLTTEAESKDDIW